LPDHTHGSQEAEKSYERNGKYLNALRADGGTRQKVPFIVWGCSFGIQVEGQNKTVS